MASWLQKKLVSKSTYFNIILNKIQTPVGYC